MQTYILRDPNAVEPQYRPCAARAAAAADVSVLRAGDVFDGPAAAGADVKRTSNKTAG